MKIRVTFEMDAEPDEISPDVQSIQQQVRYTLSDACVNFIQMRNGDGRKTIRQVVVEEMARRYPFTYGSNETLKMVEYKVRDRQARCLLAAGLQGAVLNAEVEEVVKESCPNCHEDRETQCRCGWTPGMPLEG